MKYFLFLLFFFAPFSAFAEKEPIRVGFHSSHRIIEEQNGKYMGFDAELWKRIANELNLSFEFVEVDQFSKLLSGIQSDELDVALSFITITPDRIQKGVSFSFPYFSSGISLISPSQERGTLSSLMRAFLVPAVWKTFLLFFAFTFLFANIFWFVERRSGPLDRALSPKYIPGIFQALWYAFITNSHIHLGHDSVKKCHWVTRVFSVPLWILGLLMTSILVAQLVHAFSEFSSVTSIQTIEDLHKKKVAVLEKTTSHIFLQKYDFPEKDIVFVDNISDAYDLLENKTIDAVMYDYPSLADMQLRGEKEGFSLLLSDQTLTDDFYGIALSTHFQEQFPQIRSRINQIILQLLDDGTIRSLRQKWFQELTPEKSEVDYSKGKH